LVPPGEFIAAPVQFAVMQPAEGYGEFIADPAPERAGLRKPEMMSIGRAATAGETGLGAYRLQMIPVAQPNNPFRLSEMCNVVAQLTEFGELGGSASTGCVRIPVAQDRFATTNPFPCPRGAVRGDGPGKGVP
jgi:hypothetical protein